MAYAGATVFVMIAGVAVLYRLTERFGFRLKLSALVLCAIMAFAVNFAAIMLSPYLTEQHYIRLGVLVTVAAALVTMYNEFLLNLDDRAAQKAVAALPLTEAERAMAEPPPLTETAATAQTKAVTESVMTFGALSSVERIKALRKKAFARREKIEKIKEQNADFIEKSRMDDLAKRREEEKHRAEAEEKKRQEDLKRAKEQKIAAQKREEERQKAEREREEQKRRDEQKRLELEEEKSRAERLEKERLARLAKEEEEERRASELEQQRKVAEENRRREERERAEREKRLRELEEEQKRLEDERQKREAAKRLRRVKTLDELLDDAVAAKGKGDKPGAVTALSTALRLYADDDYAPFVAIDMANIFKETGDYKAAVGANLKALNLPAVKSNPDMRAEFDHSISYLRRVDEILAKHGAAGTPFSRIPAWIMREIEKT